MVAKVDGGWMAAGRADGERDVLDLVSEGMRWAGSSLYVSV
jgi:hypothetical protein